MVAVKKLAGALNEMRRTDAPSAYAAAGKTVRCCHCNSDVFRKRRVVVRGPLAHCLICVKCGLAMWFEDAPSVKPTQEREQ